MIEIASFGCPDLTQRLQEALHDQVHFTDITLEGADRLHRPLKHIKKFARFFKGIKKQKYVLIYAFPQMWACILLAKIMRKKVIIYWIGTDVYWLKNKVKRFPIKKSDVNLSFSDNLQQELKECGIETDVLTIIPQGINLDIGEMPNEHAVLFYMPEGREAFYGYEWLTSIINRFPNLQFHIVANSNMQLFPQNNAIVHGQLNLKEMEKLYNQISIVLRFPEHDGFSLSIMEALYKGKIIIYKFHQEHTIYAETLEAVIENLQKQITIAPPQPVLEARNYALENLTVNALQTQFRYIVKKYGLG